MRYQPKKYSVDRHGLLDKPLGDQAYNRPDLTSDLTYTNTNYGKETPGFNELSRSNPLPGQSYFPEATKGLIQDQLGRDDAFYSDILNYGVDSPGISFGGGGDPMSEALAARYGGEAKQDAEAIKTRNEISAPLETMQGRTKAVSQEAQRYSNEVENYNEQNRYLTQRQNMFNQWKAMRKRQEASLIGIILGGIGALTGTVLTGGAAGGAIAGGLLGGAASKA